MSVIEGTRYTMHPRLILYEASTTRETVRDPLPKSDYKGDAIKRTRKEK